MSEAKRGSILIRWLRRIAATILLLCVVAAALLAAGMPQRWLVQSAVSKALNARVGISGLSLYDTFKIRHLAAYAKDSAETGCPPLLDIEDLEVTYALSAPDKRNISGIHIASLNIQREFIGEKTLSQASFPRRSAIEASHPNLSRFVPKNVAIDSLHFAGKGATVGFGIGGPSVSATIESANNFSAGLKGEKVTWFWWAGKLDSMRKLEGTLDIHAEKHGAGIVVAPLNVSFPGCLDVLGALHVEKKNGNIQCDITLEKAVAQDIDLSEADVRELRFPFAFERLDVSGARIQGPAGFNAGTFAIISPEIAMKLAAQGLRLGPKGHEFYEGPLQLDLTGQPGELNLVMDASFNRGQKIHATASGPAVDLLNIIEIEGWSKDDLLAVLPEQAQATVTNTPLIGLESVAIEAHLKVLTIEYQASVKPVLSTSQLPVELQVKGSAPLFSLERLATISGAVLQEFISTLTLKVADGTLTLEKNQDTPSPFTTHWTATLENISLSQWFQTFSGTAWLADLPSPLKGKIEIQADINFETFDATMDFSQGLELNAALLRQLAEMLDAHATDKNAAEKAIEQLEGKDKAAPFTCGKFRLKLAEDGISGEATFKNGTHELTLPIAL